MGRSEEILDIAQEMIQTRGYNAFSFQDIANRLGIKKASVQFYYPKKVDMVEEVFKRYTAHFSALLCQLDASPSLTADMRFKAYLGPFHKVATEAPVICLGGILGSEFNTLPKPVQAQVTHFFDLNETWLAKLLVEGRETGALQFKGPALHTARAIFSSLQGALLISRARNLPESFEQVAGVWCLHLFA